ncbi:MAG: Asp-tRNA(Asn)/Glu-tRNA(Gln) amidotransferase subunit GatB [Myxococcales bacterium]|nr:Asp-tRNA(Asn)/Glu-tRNA(Gln) amidotransferase subunit GatB [Myxococcales bacterium]
MSDFEAVIGLECHVQLDTQSKLFTGAATTFFAEPNEHIDPHTLGLPGSLPVPNRRAVELALRMGLACGCTIRSHSQFARKHYFYPDLPKGYQISQYDAPLCEGGSVEFWHDGAPRSVHLLRIHLEEDAGKNVHVAGGMVSLLDYNRAGVPLIEVVSQPDLRSAAEAAEYLRAIRRLVRYLGISDGNMEEGSLRCDANVSIRPRGSERLGTKVEIKNINSFRYVEKAIEYEIARQTDVVVRGGSVRAETRGWDAERGQSRSQRSKEEAHDYRYFPDPDLPPLHVDAAWRDAVHARLPELPMARLRRYSDGLGLPAQDALLLISERELSDYFDAALLTCGIRPAMSTLPPEQRVLAKLAANWLLSELLGALHRDGKDLGQSPISAAALGELVSLISDGTISGKQGKDVFARLYAGEKSSPAALVDALGMRQISDPAIIEEACRRVLMAPANQKQVEQYQKNPKLLGFFVGKVLAETGGRAKPDAVSALLQRLLAERGSQSP